MTEPSDDLLGHATLYAHAHGMQLETQLGYGKDGKVFSTNLGSAIKSFRQEETFRREWACYSRLQDMGISEILGFRVPQLLAADEQLLVLEISIVHRPFVLDFASAYLDDPPEFPEDAIEQWTMAKHEEFGLHWPRVVTLLEVLKQEYGIHLLDVHPGNIAFQELGGE